MFEELTDRFESIFKKLKGRGRLSETNIAEAMRDVKRALLEADVNYKVVKIFTNGVKEKALGGDVLKSVTPGQQVVKIVHEELTSLMGGTSKAFHFHTNRVNTIVLAGLQGSGKTTACAKLSLHFRKQGHRPLMVACDTHRPAAISQLETLGKSLGIPVFSDRDKKPLEICSDALKCAKREGHSLVIIDTAGRLHIDEEMMKELKDICSLSKPDEICCRCNDRAGCGYRCKRILRAGTFIGCFFDKDGWRCTWWRSSFYPSGYRSTGVFCRCRRKAGCN